MKTTLIDPTLNEEKTKDKILWAVGAETVLILLLWLIISLWG